ncbi:MAG: lipopolysaccharide biosynthesis protein [bacterium]
MKSDENNRINLKNKIVSGLAWAYAERISAQLVTFVVSIILARLIDPNEFGTISLVLIFITIANVFVTSGFGNSLIQKKSADELDFSTIFIFSFILSLFFYGLLYMIAPLVAYFYKIEQLILLIRIMSIRIPLASINSIQHAYVSKKMEFKKFYMSTLVGTIASALVGIYSAYIGFGIWALVAQYLTNIIIDTVVLWFIVDWKPCLMFSFNRLKGLFSYGWKLLFAELITVIYNDIRSLIIGKRYGPADLAYYNKGKQFPRIIVTNIVSSMSKVLFPAISKYQNERTRIKQIVSRSIKLCIFVLGPFLVGLIVIARPLVVVLLTDNWIDSVPFLQILSIYYLFMPIHAISSQAVNAIGRSDIHLKVQTTKIIIGLVLLVIAVVFFDTALIIAIGVVASALINTVIHININKKLFYYSYLEQIKDLLQPLFLALLMGIFVYLIQYLKLPMIVILILQITVGAIIYLWIAWLLKIESLIYVIKIAKDLFLNK